MERRISAVFICLILFADVHFLFYKIPDPRKFAGKETATDKFNEKKMEEANSESV